VNEFLNLLITILFGF